MKSTGIQEKGRLTNIGDKQNSQTVGNFTIENPQLQYDTIRNEQTAKSVASCYESGKNLVLEHVSLETVSEWDKDATSINENLHINRESMKAIVMLFKWVGQAMDEDYIYPNITEVSTSVNGKPNAIHSSSIKTDDLEREARRYFGNNYVSTGKFFSTQFALVLDFRSVKDQFKYNDEVKVSGSSGIQVAIKREATSKNVKCYVFVVSDSVVQIDSKSFQNTII